jgi:hypothetical protein
MKTLFVSLFPVSLLRERRITPETGTKLNHHPQSVSILSITAVWHFPGAHGRDRARLLNLPTAPIATLQRVALDPPLPRIPPQPTNFQGPDPRYSDPRRPSPTSPPRFAMLHQPCKAPAKEWTISLSGRSRSQLFPTFPGNLATQSLRKHAIVPGLTHFLRPSIGAPGHRQNATGSIFNRPIRTAQQSPGPHPGNKTPWARRPTWASDHNLPNTL